MIALFGQSASGAAGSISQRLKDPLQHHSILGRRTPKPTLPVGIKVAVAHHDERQAVGGDLPLPQLVVSFSLLTSIHPGNSHALGLIEKCDWFGMLAFPVFDNYTSIRIVGIDRQLPPHTLRADITAQPIKEVLATSDLAENLIAQVKDVVLIAILSP